MCANFMCGFNSRFTVAWFQGHVSTYNALLSLKKHINQINKKFMNFTGGLGKVSVLNCLIPSKEGFSYVSRSISFNNF